MARITLIPGHHELEHADQSRQVPGVFLWFSGDLRGEDGEVPEPETNILGAASQLLSIIQSFSHMMIGLSKSPKRNA